MHKFKIGNRVRLTVNRESYFPLRKGDYGYIKSIDHKKPMRKTGQYTIKDCRDGQIYKIVFNSSRLQGEDQKEVSIGPYLIREIDIELDRQYYRNQKLNSILQ